MFAALITCLLKLSCFLEVKLSSTACLYSLISFLIWVIVLFLTFSKSAYAFVSCGSFIRPACVALIDDTVAAWIASCNIVS